MGEDVRVQRVTVCCGRWVEWECRGMATLAVRYLQDGTWSGALWVRV